MVYLSNVRYSNEIVIVDKPKFGYKSWKKKKKEIYYFYLIVFTIEFKTQPIQNRCDISFS
jgi:accessory gene regulator protein AgrB